MGLLITQTIKAAPRRMTMMSVNTIPDVRIHRIPRRLKSVVTGSITIKTVL
jgi:hypothetical protein